jgi:hypothetical protein
VLPEHKTCHPSEGLARTWGRSLVWSSCSTSKQLAGTWPVGEPAHNTPVFIQRKLFAGKNTYALSYNLIFCFRQCRTRLTNIYKELSIKVFRNFEILLKCPRLKSEMLWQRQFRSWVTSYQFSRKLRQHWESCSKTHQYIGQTFNAFLDV